MTIVSEAPSKINLSEKHLAELRDGSGLSDATIEAAGLYTESSHPKVCKMLGWVMSDGSWNDVLVIPYPHAEGYSRIKPLWPRFDFRGKPIKYESPKGSVNRAYFGIQVVPTSGTVIITEGEKKTLRIQQAGYQCIGLSGVWNWQKKRLKSDTGRTYGKRELIDDLESINWQGLDVVITFDSDSAKNPSVQLAAARLAETLTGKGASVRVAIIPADGEEKIGADDYIVKHGEEAFRKLIDQAKEAQLPPPLSSMDLARLYVEENCTSSNGITRRWWRDEFYDHVGTHYEKRSTSELEAEVLEWQDKIQSGVKPRHAAETVKAMGALCRVSFNLEMPVYISVSGETCPNWIAFKNGILDLDAAIQSSDTKLIPHTPTFFTTMYLPYEYNAQAKCEVWYQTLYQSFDNGDDQHVADCVNLLGEYCGHLLTTDTSQQKILGLDGLPGTGKGTVIRTVTAMIGPSNVAAPSLEKLGTQFGLWCLLNKRLATITDAELPSGGKARIVLERLKAISGEDGVDISRKFLPDLENVRLPVRFVMSFNKCPKFEDSGNALARRMIILPFRNSFVGKEDHHLEGKLTAELPGILNCAIAGLRRLRKIGRFTIPAASVELLKEFKRSTNPCQTFLEDCCQLAIKRGDEAFMVSRDAIWAAWKLWCEANGESKGTKNELGTQLRACVPMFTTTQPWIGEGSDKKKIRMYQGLRLKTQKDEQDSNEDVLEHTEQTVH